MTVSATTTRNDYSASSGQAEFAYTFKALASTDLVVTRNGAVQSAYSVSGIGVATGGNVTFNSGVTANDAIAIYLAMPVTRDTNYQEGGAFLAGEVNSDFDKIYIGAIQNENAIDRSMRLPESEPSIAMTLPSKDARKGRYLQFNTTTGAPEAGPSIAGDYSAGTGLDLANYVFSIDNTVATLTGTQTLTNKTLTTPAISGNLTTDGNIDGRDVAADGTKLDTVETNADVTDTTNVTAAGALMDSELTSIASVKALNQGVATTDSPTFAAATVTGEITANGGIALGDNDRVTFGDSNDLQIYHDGTHSYVSDAGTGNLILKGTHLNLRDANNALYMEALQGGAVTLRHAGDVSLATTSTGIDVTGNVSLPDNGKATFGAGDDLEIYHDGSNSIIKDSGTGTLKYTSSAAGAQPVVFEIENTDSENSSGSFIHFKEPLSPAPVKVGGIANVFYVLQGDDNHRLIDAGAAGVKLYDGSDGQRLATTATGIDVTGTATMDGLTVDGSGTIASFKRDAGVNGQLDLSFPAQVATLNASSSFAFQTAATERMRLTPTGLGIGTATNRLGERLTVNGNGILTSSSENTNMGMFGTFGSNNLIIGAYSNIPVLFRQNNAERMRIDSSGNLLVGQTTNAETGTGIGLVPDGTSHMYSGGTDALMLGRGGSDGDILSFNRSGATVGSIGVSGGNNLYISGEATNHAGLTFATQSVLPTTQGVLNNNTVDLGQSGNAFKDLYLSGSGIVGGLTVGNSNVGSNSSHLANITVNNNGYVGSANNSTAIQIATSGDVTFAGDIVVSGGVYLGGTGAANKLDDYEEGTWTPAYTGSSTSPTGISQFVDARYTVVGRAVHCVLHTYMSAFTGGSGDVRINLPFTANSATKQSGALGRSAGWGTTKAPRAFIIEASGTFLTLLASDSADARDNINDVVQYADMTTYDEIYVCFTYFLGT